MTSSSPKPAPTWRQDLLFLVLAFGLLLGFRLGSHPLANPDESRYAEIPREMVATADWVTPRLDGVNYFEKPPLVYWLVAGFRTVFGPSEWAMRATPALFALGGVLLTYAAARRLHGRNAGLASAVVLGTSLLYFGLGRVLILDMALAVLMSAALFGFILAVREPPGRLRRLLFYGLYIAMALATLTKGLIGFLVTGAVMFLWLFIFNQWKRLRPLYLPTGALLFLALAGPWHVLAALRNETWVHRYFVYEHWLRFTTDAADRPGPAWYFVPVVLLGLFPWSGFLWAAMREAVRSGWAARKQHAEVWFFGVWVGFIFLFFSKSHSKLIPYILPVFPALAVLIGTWLARALQDRAEWPRFRSGLRVFALVAGLLAVALAVAVLKPGVIRDPVQLAGVRPYALALAGVLLAGGVLGPWLARTRGPRPALGAVLGTMVLMFGLLSLALPHVQRVGTQDLAEIVAARAQPEDRVVHYGEFFHDFVYYGERLVDLAGTAGELGLRDDATARASGRFYDLDTLRRHWAGAQRVWVVVRNRDLSQLTADPSFSHTVIAANSRHTLLSNRP